MPKKDSKNQKKRIVSGVENLDTMRFIVVRFYTLRKSLQTASTSPCRRYGY